MAYDGRVPLFRNLPSLLNRVWGLSNARQFIASLSSWIVKRRLRLVPTHACFVAVSTWQADCARQSEALRERAVDVISYCIDKDIVFPVPKPLARAALGLEENANVVLAGALYNRETP